MTATRLRSRGAFPSGQKQKESRSRLPCLRRDRRPELYSPAQARRREAEDQEVLPPSAQAHAPHREEKINLRISREQTCSRLSSMDKSHGRTETRFGPG